MGILDNIPGFGASPNGTGETPSSNGAAEPDEPARNDETELPPSGDAAPRNGETTETAASADEQAARTKEKARKIMSTRYTFTTKEEPTAERPFAHGYIDGAEEVDKTPFERFVRIQAEVERINEELDRLSEREQELKSTRTERIELEAEVERDRTRLEAYECNTAETEEAYNEATVTHASVENADREAEAEESESARDDSTSSHRGSLVYGALYTTAGIVFMAAEIVMSKEVVATGLRIEKPIEKWTFALGIASLAVLLKPAYDRMVESPYWKGNKRPFRRLIIGAVMLTMITLAVLGAFRMEAYSNQKKEDSLIKQRTDLQEERRDIKERIRFLENQNGFQEKRQSLNADLNEVESGIQQRSQELQELDESRFDSWLPLLAFLLTGLLFAVAGAITLGIGLGHLRRWLSRSRRQDRLTRLQKQQESLREKRETQRVKLRGRKKKLSHMPTMDVLNEQLRRVEEKQEGLRASRSAAIGNQGVEAYTSGYDLAQKSDASFKVMPASRPSANGVNGASPHISSSPKSKKEENDKSSSRRLFLRVRDEISNNVFNSE